MMGVFACGGVPRGHAAFAVVGVLTYLFGNAGGVVCRNPGNEIGTSRGTVGIVVEKDNVRFAAAVDDRVSLAVFIFNGKGTVLFIVGDAFHGVSRHSGNDGIPGTIHKSGTSPTSLAIVAENAGMDTGGVGSRFAGGGVIAF